MTDPSAPRLTAKGRATRERIVAAAADLMFLRGVAGTSTDDVQRAAGVSASQLYHYFADKRALVAAVIAHQTEVVVGPQEPLLAQADVLGALRTVRDYAVGMQTERGGAGGCPLATLAVELVETDADARADLRSAFDRWAAAIAGGLRAMRDRGELPADADPDRLALAVLAALQGGLVLTQVRRDPGPLAAAMDTVLEHIAALARTAAARP